MSKPKEFWIDTEDVCTDARVYEEPMASCIHVIEKSAYDKLLAQAEAMAEMVEKLKFTLQMMIINTNGKVPGLTDQQVFDGAIEARNDSRRVSEAWQKFKGEM